MFIHVQDMRRPLGIPEVYSREVLRAVLDDCVSPNSWAAAWTNAKQRIEGLRLRAPDVDWEHGAGPEVTGSGEAIIMAVHGRRAAMADLTGAGVDLLRSADDASQLPLR